MTYATPNFSIDLTGPMGGTRWQTSGPRPD